MIEINTLLRRISRLTSDLESYCALTRRTVGELSDSLSAHVEATTDVHGATSSAVAERIIIRDAYARAKVNDPSADDDIDTQGARNAAIASHASANTGVHGVGTGTIVGTTLTQTLSNKTLVSPIIQGGSVTANISVSDGVTIDGIDISAHNSANTGVHGVGSYYIPQAPLSGFLVRSFCRGWTSGKLLKGSGANTDPTEISGWQVVAEVTLSTNAQYVDFTGLDINTDKMYWLFINTKNTTGSSYGLYLYREGDYTASNYYSQALFARGATVSADAWNAPRILTLTANDDLAAYLTIFRSLRGYMIAFSRTSYSDVTSPYIALWTVTSTNTTTNITSLRIYSAGANPIESGSMFILCKPRTG
jgi:hypothetical protein